MGITRVLVSGAAGQIGYSILPLLAQAKFLPSNKAKVHLVMYDLPEKSKIMEGVAMELEDCSFKYLDGVSIITESETAFKEVDIAILLASCQWKKGMERSALLGINKGIFSHQGAMIGKYAKPSTKVLVVGNPANTNAFVCYKNATEMPHSNFSCLSRLDHNRSIFQLAKKMQCSISEVKKVFILGNHSSTQYPDASYAEIQKGTGGSKTITRVTDKIDQKWLQQDFVEIIRERVWEVANRRNNTSALSPAKACIDHIKNWMCGTKNDDWVSMGLVSDGSYGVPKGLVSSFPVLVSSDGIASIVQNLDLSEIARSNLDISIKEMLEELRNAGMTL